MKSHRSDSPARSARGSALLAILCLATVLTVALGSYLALCRQALALSNRASQATWSATLAEAGIEDALWSLNTRDWTGWAIEGSSARKAVSGFSFGGGATGRLELSVSDYASTADPLPSLTVTAITEQPDGRTTRRTFQADTTPAPLLANAVVATTSRVRFRSAGVVDSYDSRRGDYTAQVPGFSAIVASTARSSVSAPVQLTNATVRGVVATTGNAPTYSSSARILGPDTPVTVRIDASRISTAARQFVFDEIVPTGPGDILPAGSATIGTPGATSPTLYYAAELLLGNGQTLTVAGPVVIVVSGDLAISGTGKIRVTTTGAVRLHLAGDLAINGGGVQNDTRLPRNFILIATRSPYESYGMATNTPFYGVLYAPVSSLTISNNQSIYGAIVAKAVTFNASPSIHYDVALRALALEGIATPAAIKAWHETPSAE